MWEEPWEELHHQDCVDQASCAAVPHLLEFARQSRKLDWNVFGLIATIELARPENPKPNKALADSYFSTIGSVLEVLAVHRDRKWSAELMQTAATCIALARGQRKFAEIDSEFRFKAGQEWMKSEFDF